MKTETLLKKYVIVAAGSLLLGMGIGFADLAALGTDPFTVFLTGTYRRVGVSLGTMNLIINFMQIVMAFMVRRDAVSAATVIAMIGTSAGIDLPGLIGIPVLPLPAGALWLVSGLMLYSLGIALTQIPKCGYSPYDAYILSLIKLFPCEYHVMRWITDLIFVVTGWLLGGTVGIGTIVFLIFTGRLVEIILDFLEK